jgi:hypothetical protein
VFSLGLFDRLFRNRIDDQRGMMKASFFWILIAGACVGFSAITAGAQSKDSTRSTEVQPLRYEPYFGNVRIIRGADGPIVGTAGWFRDFDVEKLVATSPSALTDARLYKTNNFRASVVGSIGATVTLIGVAVTANASNNAASPILIIGGVGAMAWAAQHFTIAYSALSRSLWWYNRDLARAK